MASCLFCNIVNGTITSELIHEDDQCLAFRDISPQAPIHILLIPKIHLASLNDLNDDHRALSGHLMLQAQRIAVQENISADGYRIVINCGQNGGQTVSHLHMHILGGRSLMWPPG